MLKPCGADLAQKFKAHPRAKCFPVGVRDTIVKAQAPIFELFSVSTEYEAALTLLYKHYEFTRSEGYDADKQAYSTDKNEIRKVSVLALRSNAR